MGFKKIDGSELERVLTKYGRQYLVGNLKLPQQLAHVESSDIEIGITHYDDATYEAPHWHPTQHEYQLMLSGKTKYKNSLTGEEYQYDEGDFYCIDPFTCYSQESLPGTRILFIKIPAINDKTMCVNCDNGQCISRIAEFESYKEIPGVVNKSIA